MPTAPLKRKKRVYIPSPKAEPLLFDSDFYQKQYIRALKLAIAFLFSNFLILMYCWVYLQDDHLADVYVATLEGKMFAIKQFAYVPPNKTEQASVNAASNPQK